MEQYIKKSDIIAEIERLVKKYSQCPTHTFYEEGLKGGRLIGYNDALFKIDTLEVKEINSADAFIEKACEFFGEHLWEYIDVKNANCDTFINIDGDKLKEDFKNYMKGE